MCANSGIAGTSSTSLTQALTIGGGLMPFQASGTGTDETPSQQLMQDSCGSCGAGTCSSHAQCEAKKPSGSAARGQWGLLGVPRVPLAAQWGRFSRRPQVLPPPRADQIRPSPASSRPATAVPSRCPSGSSGGRDGDGPPHGRPSHPASMDPDLLDPPVACHACWMYVRQSQFPGHARTKRHKIRLEAFCRSLANSCLWTLYVRVTVRLGSRGRVADRPAQAGCDGLPRIPPAQV